MMLLHFSNLIFLIKSHNYMFYFRSTPKLFYQGIKALTHHIAASSLQPIECIGQGCFHALLPGRNMSEKLRIFVLFSRKIFFECYVYLVTIYLIALPSGLAGLKKVCFGFRAIVAWGDFFWWLEIYFSF